MSSKVHILGIGECGAKAIAHFQTQNFSDVHFATASAEERLEEYGVPHIQITLGHDQPTTTKAILQHPVGKSIGNSHRCILIGDVNEANTVAVASALGQICRAQDTLSIAFLIGKGSLDTQLNTLSNHVDTVFSIDVSNTDSARINSQIENAIRSLLFADAVQTPISVEPDDLSTLFTRAGLGRWSFVEGSKNEELSAIAEKALANIPSADLANSRAIFLDMCTSPLAGILEASNIADLLTEYAHRDCLLIFSWRVTHSTDTVSIYAMRIKS